MNLTDDERKLIERVLKEYGKRVNAMADLEEARDYQDDLPVHDDQSWSDKQWERYEDSRQDILLEDSNALEELVPLLIKLVNPELKAAG